MQYQKVCSISLSILVILSSHATAAYAVGLQHPNEEIIIHGYRRSARFAHPLHVDMGIECGACHHDQNHQPLVKETINAMENSRPLRCISCHNDLFENQNLQTRKAIFHARCKECHKKGVDGKKGPIRCYGCHIRKKRSS